MIKGCRLPGRSVVAGFASLCKAPRHVVRVGRVLKIGRVARHARRTRQTVVVVHVAVSALARRHRVRPRQCEPGRAVVEGRIGPCTSAVALLASLRET